MGIWSVSILPLLLPFHGAFGVAIGNVLLAVIEAFALNEADFNLDLALLEIELERDESETALADLRVELAYFPLMHEQAAATQRLDAGVGRMAVGAYVQIDEPRFAVGDFAECIAQIKAALAYAFHLVAFEGDARLDALKDGVIAQRLAVDVFGGLGFLFWRIFGHICFY